MQKVVFGGHSKRETVQLRARDAGTPPRMSTELSVACSEAATEVSEQTVARSTAPFMLRPTRSPNAKTVAEAKSGDGADAPPGRSHFAYGLAILAVLGFWLLLGGLFVHHVLPTVASAVPSAETPPSPPPPAEPSAYHARLAQLAASSAAPRRQALLELAAGQKRGHWIWWVFPTLAARGGDMNSAYEQADLASVDEAVEYARHAELRAGLLRSLRAAAAALAAVEASGEARAPWRLFDSGFGRSSNGTWIGGPVDSFKVWASATLFAALAQRGGDPELQAAAVDVVGHFKGDVVYAAGGPGTAGYVEGAPARRIALRGGDEATLGMLPGGASWDAVRRVPATT